MVGIAYDDMPNAFFLQEFAFTPGQVHGHRGSGRVAPGLFDQKLAAAFRTPPPGPVLAGFAAHHVNLLGHRKGGVEADTELPDERGILLLVTGQALQELRGAGPGDGAEVLDQFIVTHTDAVIGDGDGPLLLVDRKFDAETGPAGQQVGIGQRQISQLVAGIGGVRNQFTQEYLLVGVQGVHDDIQDLPDLGLKLEFFFAHVLHSLARPTMKRVLSSPICNRLSGFRKGWGLVPVCSLIFDRHQGIRGGHRLEYGGLMPRRPG